MSPLTWEDLLDHCSRLHTARTRLRGPWQDAGMREDSQMLDAWLEDRPVVVVPTRMHEPGFYVRSPNGHPHWMLRTDAELQQFHDAVDAGKVSRREENVFELPVTYGRRRTDRCICGPDCTGEAPECRDDCPAHGAESVKVVKGCHSSTASPF